MEFMSSKDSEDDTIDSFPDAQVELAHSSILLMIKVRTVNHHRQ